MLAFVFASFLAIVPMVIAAVSILSTFLVILGLTYITEVSFIVEFLVALVGLGIAIDYSLLLVTRWREERAKGLANHDAIVRAVETAGRSVVLSGVTVAIGLLALIVLPVPGLRSTGIGGMLIPLVSIVVVNTLLPALLGGIGPRVDWPRVRKEAHASRGWSAWGHAGHQTALHSRSRRPGRTGHRPAPRVRVEGWRDFGLGLFQGGAGPRRLQRPDRGGRGRRRTYAPGGPDHGHGRSRGARRPRARPGMSAAVLPSGRNGSTRRYV